MSEWAKIKKSTLEGIGNAIREKEGSSDLIPTAEMKPRILAIKTGTDTSDATATSEDILFGKTAYVNDVKVVGAIEDYDGSVENSTENAIIKANIDRTKYRDYINYTIYELGNISIDEVYEKVELKCQEYYSRIMGV